MRNMCAERNKFRRVFSTAIDLVKAANHAVVSLAPYTITRIETHTWQLQIRNARGSVVCKIPLLARVLGLKARPSARATIGYLVYKW